MERFQDTTIKTYQMVLKKDKSDPKEGAYVLVNTKNKPYNTKTSQSSYRYTNITYKPDLSMIRE